jgi:amino acid transporter
MDRNLDRTWRNGQRAGTFQRAAARLFTNPLVLAADGLLPKALAKLDVHGTPRMAIIVSAVFYSLFVLVSFSKLVVADVLLYSLALFLEFGALVQLRKTEPSLRGVFRIPLGRGGVAVLAALPMMVLLGVIGVSIRRR